MVSRTQYETLLDRLGLTRAGAACLAFFFVFYGLLQQHFPAGEPIIISPFSTPAIIFAYAIVSMCYAIICERTEGGVHLTTLRFWRGYTTLLVITAFYYMFFLSFGCAKSLIPLFQPYYLDPFLQKLDIMLHAGYAPSQWLIDVISPTLQYKLNMTYLFSWGLVMAIYFFWILASPPGKGRTAFISSFIMAWIIAGIVLATLGASVGPLFYGMFYYDGYSAMNLELAHRLYNPEILTPALYPQNARNILLDFYSDGTLVHLNGISAMPSMHTAVAILIMLHSLRYARWLCFFTIPFALAIFVGSFALGWHYAVDTYVSGATVYAIWWYNHRHFNRSQQAA